MQTCKYYTAADGDRLYVFDGHKRKLAGIVRQYGPWRVLEKHVLRSRHYHHLTDAWAVDRDILAQARQEGVTHVLLIDREDNLLYGAPVEFFDRYGVARDYGHGVQVFLGIEYWRRKARGGENH